MDSQLRLWSETCHDSLTFQAPVPRKRIIHILSGVDRERKTAHCAQCGWTDVYFNSTNGSAQCAEAARIRARENKAKRRKK